MSYQNLECPEIMPVEGVDKCIKNLEEFKEKAWQIAAAAFWDINQETLAESLAECPVKTGALRSTGKTELTVTPDEITCDIGYGSDAVNYAYRQHEDLSFYHNPPTKAKYLEDPINRNLPKYPEKLKERLAPDKVRSGGGA
jgi:hypothetical protein